MAILLKYVEELGHPEAIDRSALLERAAEGHELTEEILLLASQLEGRNSLPFDIV